jgi:hypothetical protein
VAWIGSQPQQGADAAYLCVLRVRLPLAGPEAQVRLPLTAHEHLYLQCDALQCSVSTQTVLDSTQTERIGSMAMQGPEVQAAAVHLPPSRTAVDTAFYKDGQLALLLAPERSDGSDGGNGGVSLALLPLSGLPLVTVPAEQQAADILQV